MLKGITIAEQMASVASGLKQSNAVAGVQGMAVWERTSDGPLDFVSPNHHTLSIYQGGGRRTYSCEARTWGFSEAICLFPEGYDTHWQHQGHVKNLHIYFTAADYEALTWTKARAPDPVIFGRNPSMRALSQVLVGQLDWQERGDALAVDHVVMALLSQMGQGGEVRGRLPDASLARLEDRMRDLSEGPPALAELAAEVGLSPRHLSRLFKETTGETLSARQRVLQVEEAQRLLATDMPLAEVALAAGFSSQSHFARRFREAVGLSPGAYRRGS